MDCFHSIPGESVVFLPLVLYLQLHLLMWCCFTFFTCEFAADCFLSAAGSCTQTTMWVTTPKLDMYVGHNIIAVPVKQYVCKILEFTTAYHCILV